MKLKLLFASVATIQYDKLCYSEKTIARQHPFFTWYSILNSCSKNESRRSSQESSKAVRMGSLDDSAIKDGDASAR